MKEKMQPRSEKQVISHYLGAFSHVYERKGPAAFEDFYVQHLQGTDTKGNTSYGIRIVFDRKLGAKTVALMDYDDNLVNTTESKKRFVDSLLETIPADKKSEFSDAYVHINRAARVLPSDGTHPERYSPLLDMLAVSEAINSLTASDHEKIRLPQNETEARTFIKNVIDLQPNLTIGTKKELKIVDGVEQEKLYFIENEEQSAGINFRKEPPQNVRKDVWMNFKKNMTNVDIPENELEYFDIPDDVRFIVATFGQLDQQLEKLAKTIRRLKRKGKRIPDEIIVITDGRKEPILKQIIDASQNAQCVYGDDSVNQLEKMIGTKNTVLVRGWRKGTKRALDITPEGVRQFDMTTTPHSKIIFDALHDVV